MTTMRSTSSGVDTGALEAKVKDMYREVADFGVKSVSVLAVKTERAEG